MNSMLPLQYVSLLVSRVSPLAVAVASIMLATSAWGGPSSTAKQRARVIDFDDDVVEALNKRPLDSLSQISERDRKKHKPHLYRKRVGFRTEMAETLRVLRFTP